MPIVKVIYRMSDMSQVVPRPSYVNVVNCFLNFITNVYSKNLIVIADNIKDQTFSDISEITQELQNTQIIRTATNNAESFRTALNLSLQENDDTVVFFVEDDYIWKPNSLKILLEGIPTNRYISLYDHPDKYTTPLYEFGEISKIYLTESCHWKTTLSTPMTFACYVKTLKEDLDLILESLENRSMTWSSKMFKSLYSKYNTHVVSTPIPSYATHGMNLWLAPYVDWETVMKESLKY